MTFFRRALVAEAAERDSQLATRDIYMVHFALSDAQNERFYAFERFSRDGGGSPEPRAIRFASFSKIGRLRRCRAARRCACVPMRARFALDLTVREYQVGGIAGRVAAGAER
ncbi:carotenoid 1,2-hydratase, partial [Candidatus Gracilibacteria bacterium]|nr:carotenoid 1,2-hydratase [Candidatus Gracilibacteria bacterium]